MTTLRNRIGRLIASTSALFLGTFSLAFAQGAQPTGADSAATTSLGHALLLIVNIINNVLVPLIFAVAFIVFIWGVFRYFILGATNEEKRTEGQKLIIWGLIGFFIMLSLWGIINVLKGTFFLGSDTQPPYPTFTVNGSASGDSKPATTVLPASQTTPPANGGCPSGTSLNQYGLCI